MRPRQFTGGGAFRVYGGGGVEIDAEDRVAVVVPELIFSSSMSSLRSRLRSVSLSLSWSMIWLTSWPKRVGVVAVELAYGVQHRLVEYVGLRPRRRSVRAAVAVAGEAGVVTVQLSHSAPCDATQA